MASAFASVFQPDTVLSFEINPGTLLQFLEARAEKGPRLKCFEGSVTLVSPGRSHEHDLDRISSVVLAICMELRIEHDSLRSETWKLPQGVGDTAYEPDAAYYIQSYGRVDEHQPPDLAIEIVVTNPATKALWAGEFLKIPELWVYDIPKRRLTFNVMVTRGKHKGTYRSVAWSRAFPFLAPAYVLQRMDDPATGALAFLENCREWTRRVLIPRVRVGDQEV